MTSHAEKCPICNGTGKISSKCNDDVLVFCHGCNGKGWVTVQN